MRIRHTLSIIVLTLLKFHYVSCFFDPVTLGVGGLGLGLLGAGYHKLIKCKIFECCNDDYIPINVTDLQQELATRLYGQHIVQRTVVHAIRGYKATAAPPKALAVSFHGPAGTGKNYVSSLIVSSFYKLGVMSNFYHLFSGSTFSQRRLEEHKEIIKNIVVETLLQCESSIFVFDEVHKMPEGLLDVLLPFMDYAQPIFIEYKSQRIRVRSNRAIFIFLSNAGATGILGEMLKFWLEGRKRNTLKLQDFENLISGDALRENNGFLNGSAIESSLIDYYVPFLPLEEEHVKLCVKDAFDKDQYTEAPTSLMKQDVLSTVIYGPSPYNIYATGGCKRLETKVASARQIDQASAL